MPMADADDRCRWLDRMVMRHLLNPATTASGSARYVNCFDGVAQAFTHRDVNL